MKGLKNRGGWAAFTLLATAAMGTARPTPMPVPGTVNYVEGQVSLNGQNLSVTSPGSSVLEANQVLETGQGRAELLLTPGVFFRVGDNSEIRMVSPGLADTKVELVKGSAMLEVTWLSKANDLSVAADGMTTRIEKEGLYDFRATPPQVSVLDGRATVFAGNDHVTLKKGHEVLFAGGLPLKAQRLEKNAVNADSLYRWSALRSQYEAQANVDVAQTVVVNGGWYGAGWYWDPYLSYYSYVPGDGFLYSPFGWGFYSPGFASRSPFYYHYHGRGNGFSSYSAPMGGMHGGAGAGFHGGGGGGHR
jgi:hypothetical protein